ncbi:hypothetical protein [Tengunoibacter tsumagoiensis]|uniref:Uncharacterized protein n=1 Tax=Tengunoibacter tsumagoiensis TaxID=2014871 RepID=A0A401ZTM5_9CHLR|nr:hypothetical protein [Tengunoibacter tsumagoiensis]GCE10221.1 hypothetical protein KTT_00800 [Tengunoibacter tsumagoiensis]
MLRDRLWYELKLGWRVIVGVPMCAMGIVVLFTLLQYFLHQSVTRTWLSGLEMFLPLSAGIVATSLLSQDKAIELQLTMPRSYGTTNSLRLGIIFVWSALLACCCLIGIELNTLLPLPAFQQSWTPMARVATLQLLWLAPLLFFLSLGFCLALIIQSRTASGALLGGIWLVAILFVDTIASVPWLRPFLLFPSTLLTFPLEHVSQTHFTLYWWNTRWDQLVLSLLFFIAAWLLSQNTERLLKGSTEE